MSHVIELEPPIMSPAARNNEHALAESARAPMLCMAAQLEHKLGEILREFLLDGPQARDLIEGPLASLASLSTRIRSCYALGLIDEHEFADCEIVSRIHDEFHRSPYATFSDTKVIVLCRKFHFRNRGRGELRDDPQEQFRTAAAALLDRLANRPFFIGHEKRTRRTWPV